MYIYVYILYMYMYMYIYVLIWTHVKAEVPKGAVGLSG